MHLNKKVFRATLILLAITILACDSINKPDIGSDVFWEPVNKLPGSNQTQIHAIIVADNGDVWASNSRGVYVSTDNGDTWVQKNNFPFNPGSIAVSPVNGYLFVKDYNYGTFRSTDNGESWIKVIDYIGIREILISPSGEIYVIARERIYYSNDNGDTWIEKITNRFPNEDIISVALGTDGTLYAATYSKGVYRLAIGTNNWMPPSNYADVLARTLAISDDGLIFVAASANGVLKSTDKGIYWDQVNIMPDIDYTNSNKVFYNPVTKDLFVTCQLLRHVSGYIDDSEKSQVYRSTDLGASWRLEGRGLPNDQWKVLFAANPNTGQMFLTTDNDVYRTKNYPN